MLTSMLAYSPLTVLKIKRFIGRISQIVTSCVNFTPVLRVTILWTDAMVAILYIIVVLKMKIFVHRNSTYNNRQNVQNYNWLCDIYDVQLWKSDWAEVTRPPRDAWKSTTMDRGEQFVMIRFLTSLPVLSATILDSGLHCSAWLFLPYIITLRCITISTLYSISCWHWYV